MKRITFLVPTLSYFLSVIAFGQVVEKAESEGATPTEVAQNVREPKALDIIKKADIAIKKITSVQYSSSREISGPMAERLSPASGVVLYSMESQEGLPKYRVTVSMKPRHSAEELRFTIGSDGDLFYLIDPAKKMVYEDMDPAVAGNRGGVARGLVMAEYMASDPFGDELKADTVAYQGIQSVSGEDCHVVRVVYGRGQESIWSFSTKDYLPRRRDSLFRRGQGPTSHFTVTLTDLVVRPKFEDNAFNLKVPEGFTKTDEFAPDLERKSPQ